MYLYLKFPYFSIPTLFDKAGKPFPRNIGLIMPDLVVSPLTTTFGCSSKLTFKEVGEYNGGNVESTTTK